MATIALFLLGVISLLCFDPSVTAYIYGETSLKWKFVTLFTHIVSHGNWSHLIGNFIFGGPYLLYLEHKLKSTKKFVRLFFVFGFAAFAFQYIVSQFSMFPGLGLIGSSGAIFGVIGYSLNLRKKSKVINLLSKSLLCFFIITQAMSAHQSLYWPDGVAYAAHLGGLLAGVALSLRRRPGRRRR